MRSSRRTATILGGMLVGVALNGCGAGVNGPASDTRAATATQAVADLYVAHKGTSEESPRLSAYRIDPRTGALAAVPGSPYALPLEDRVYEIAVDAGSRYVYVATRHGTSSLRGLVYAYSRDAATGALTALPGSPFGDGHGADFRSPVFDPTSSFLYVSDPLTEYVDVFAFEAASGALRPLSGRNSFPAANNIDGMAVARSGRSLYATTSDGLLLAYAIDPAGALSSQQPALQAGRSTGIPVEAPSGRWLYAPNAGSNDISGYSVDPANGQLTPLRNSPFSAGAGVVALALAPSGEYLYAVNGLEATVSTFRVEAGTGALRPTAPALPTGGTTNSAGSIVVEPGGHFAYVSNFAAGTLSAYTVDVDSGELRAIASISTPPRPAALAVTHSIKD